MKSKIIRERLSIDGDRMETFTCPECGNERATGTSRGAGVRDVDRLALHGRPVARTAGHAAGVH